MVDQSELAFRELLRDYHSLYDAHRILCYTPMIHAAMFVDDQTYRRQRFVTCERERGSVGGLVAQFCGNDPQTLLRAARLVEREVDAVDLNLGCPQNIAQKGNYGSYLMRQGDLVEEIISVMVAGLQVPVVVKVRLMDEKSPKVDERGLQGTLNFCRRLEAAGASAVCVHGRTREQKSFKTGSADWASIARVKACLRVPVIANGGVETYEDVEACLRATGADAVMSAEALLENPTLFVHPPVYDPDYLSTRPLSSAEGQAAAAPPADQCRPLRPHKTPTAIALEYLESSTRHPPSEFYKCVKAHVLKLAHRPIALAKEDDDEGGGGAVAAEAVLTSRDPDELERAVRDLGSFMARRAAQMSACEDCGEPLAQASTAPGDTEDGAESPVDDEPLAGGAEPPVETIRRELQLACQCWRERTWYRRHRNAEAAALDVRKERRRGKYLALGFVV